MKQHAWQMEGVAGLVAIGRDLAIAVPAVGPWRRSLRHHRDCGLLVISIRRSTVVPIRLARFAERLRAHAHGPRWGCALGEIDGQPVAYASGFARTAGYCRTGLLTSVQADQLAETDTCTFALCEVMVRTA